MKTKKLKIGIECESIETDSWGISRALKKMLEEIAKKENELKDNFEFFLFFKGHIPDYSYLNSPIFVKKLIKLPLQKFSSFSLYYYILLPVYLWFRKLDLMLFPNYMLPILFVGKSLVFLTEDNYTETRNPALPLRYRLAYMIFSNWAAIKSDYIGVYSNTSAKKVSELFKIDQKRIFVNPLGVSVGTSLENNNHKLKSDDYFLYVAQAFPRRHLREIIIAFKLIAKENQKIRLFAIGQDKYKPPIIDRMIEDTNKELGRIAITREDFVSDMKLNNLYKGAIATTYISETEAFGLPPLESLAHDTPPIVADTKITREIFEDNAFFVEMPITPESILNILKESMTNYVKRESIISNKNVILNKYSWTAHTDRFIEFCKNTI